MEQAIAIYVLVKKSFGEEQLKKKSMKCFSPH